jgi:hypothetical protein
MINYNGQNISVSIKGNNNDQIGKSIYIIIFLFIYR